MWEKERAARAVDDYGWKDRHGQLGQRIGIWANIEDRDSNEAKYTAFERLGVLFRLDIKLKRLFWGLLGSLGELKRGAFSSVLNILDSPSPDISSFPANRYSSLSVSVSVYLSLSVSLSVSLSFSLSLSLSLSLI